MSGGGGIGDRGDRRADLARIEEALRAAGALLAELAKRDLEVERKAGGDPVTEADRRADALLRELLVRDGEGWLSEESADDPARLACARVWVVDPLDGTKEFIKRNGEFTVNIALIERHKPVLGVVEAPALGIVYAGSIGIGAFKQQGSARRRIAIRRPAAEPLRVVGSRSHASPELRSFLERLGPHELKSMGSSLKICLVAEGEADLYPRLGPTSEWDTAAAEAILISAGGSMMDLEGQPLAYNARETLLNPHFLAMGDDIRDRLTCLRNG